MAKAWKGVMGHWKSMVNSSLPTRPNLSGRHGVVAGGRSFDDRS